MLEPVPYAVQVRVLFWNCFHMLDGVSRDITSTITVAYVTFLSIQTVAVNAFFEKLITRLNSTCISVFVICGKNYDFWIPTIENNA